jgi:hypothetical protein
VEEMEEMEGLEEILRLAGPEARADARTGSIRFENLVLLLSVRSA